MAFLPTDQQYQFDQSTPADSSSSAGNGGVGGPIGPAGPSDADVISYYRKKLGRAPGEQGGNLQAELAWEKGDPNWQHTIDISPEAQAYAARSAAPAAPASYSGGTPPIASAQGTNPALTALRNTLMARANQSLTVNPNDPTIKAQTDAYRADVTRGGRDFLSQQAESAGPINNMDAAYRSVGEKAGQAVADYRGKLMQGVVDARRQEIAQALSGQLGLISQDEQTRLRQEDQDLARQRFGADTSQQAFEDQYKTIFG